jgi:amino acid transporter
MFMPSHVVGLNRIPMLGLCILGILTLSIIHGTLGAFHPNFSEGDNPEQVSTSTMGLLALAMSVVEIFLLNWVGYRILENTMSVPVGFSLAGSISLLIASWLYIGTRQHFLHHETNHN